ncbi:GNAT family N-acetyltransferase [Geodermatophilus sp. SYSU D00815]
MEEFAVERLDAEAERAWDALALASGTSPFLRPGWVLASVSAFGDDDALRLASVRRDGALVAVLPLVRRRGGFSAVSNSETSETGLVARDDDAARALVAGLLRRRVPQVDLPGLPVSELTARVLRQVEPGSPRPFLWYPAGQNPYVDVSGDWAGYEAERLSSKRRQRLRNIERRLAKLGAVEFQVVAAPGAELPRLLEEGFGIELAGWKGRAGTAVLSAPTTRELYWRSGAWAAEAGILRLAFLRVGGRPAAFAMNLEQDGRRYGLKFAYSEEFAQHSPGTLMLQRMVRHGFEEPGLSRFFFLGAPDDYKLVFADGVEELVRVRMFGRGPAAIARRAYQRARSTARAHVPERVLRRLPRWTGVEQWVGRHSGDSE